MLFKKLKKDEVVLCVDIGSSSVGASLVSISPENSPKIIFSTRSPVTLLYEPERRHMVSSAVEALDAVMKLVIEQHINFHRSHIFFSSPWCSSETKILNNEQAKPIVVTKHVIEKLTDEAEGEFLKNSNSQNRIIEHKIIRVRLNGYETANPYNKRAKSLEVTFFASMVQKDILESVERVLQKHYHIKKEEMHSFSLAAFNAMLKIVPEEKSFLIIDVRGEVTDLSSVVDGALIKNLAFAPGKDALIKAVSAGSGNSLPASLFLINATYKNSLKTTSQNKVKELAEGYKKDWMDNYNKSLYDVYGSSVVPHTIFLITDMDVEDFFEGLISEFNTEGTLHLLKYLNIKNYLESSSVSTDQFLALESIFATML